MSKTVRDRVFILVIAAAFLFTTIGVSVALIWELARGDDNNNNTSQTDKQAKRKSEGKKMDNFTPVASVDSLQVIDVQPGTGTEVKAGDTVTVDYTGAVAATGAIFQSSLDTGQPVTFGLNQVIEGWKNGMVGMKQGGKRRLLIPAEQAYGANPPAGSGIPANAALVFDITLHQVASK